MTVPDVTILKRFLTSAVIGAVPVLSWCFFATLTIYAGNSDEFSVSFLQLLRVYLPYMLAMIVVFGLLGAMLRDDMLKKYWSVIAAFGVLIWLQGNIMVWDYGVLDGREIEWLADRWRGVLDLTIWAVVLLLAIVAYKRVGRVLIYSALAVLAIQTVNAVTILGHDSGELLTRISIEPSRVGADALLRFSPRDNVVHIVMDGFQADIFEAIIDDPAYSHIRHDLKGFTLFRDNLGVFPYTQMTVPALLSGKLYRNHVPADDFLSDTIKGETVFSVATDAGYEVDIAAPAELKNMYSLAKHTNAYRITSNDHVSTADYVRKDSAKLLDLALFRVVPHFAKAMVYRDELWVFQPRVSEEDYLHMQYFADLSFLRRLADGMSVDRESPVYKLIHVMLSHRPTVGNENCKYDGKHRTSRVAVTNQARCGLLHVLGVLKRMQELGIYDNSLIVLMADHGAWVPVENFTQDPDSGNDVKPLTVAMAIPVLAIKPPGSQGAWQVSNAPTSVIDVPATIVDILGLNANFAGIPAYSLDPDAPRERRHLTYGYGINPKAKGYLFPMHEYKVVGNPYHASSWRMIQQHRPPENSAGE